MNAPLLFNNRKGLSASILWETLPSRLFTKKFSPFLFFHVRYLTLSSELNEVPCEKEIRISTNMATKLKCLKGKFFVCKTQAENFLLISLPNYRFRFLCFVFC